MLEERENTTFIPCHFQMMLTTLLQLGELWKNWAGFTYPVSTWIAKGVEGLKAERCFKLLVRDESFIDWTMDKLNLAICFHFTLQEQLISSTDAISRGIQRPSEACITNDERGTRRTAASTPCKRRKGH